MSFDAKLPGNYADLKKEAATLSSQASELERKIDSGMDGGGCSCSCSACDDCEEREYLSDAEIEELEEKLKPIAKQLASVRTTMQRLERYAARAKIELEPANDQGN